MSFSLSHTHTQTQTDYTTLWANTITISKKFLLHFDIKAAVFYLLLSPCVCVTHLLCLITHTHTHAFTLCALMYFSFLLTVNSRHRHRRRRKRQRSATTSRAILKKNFVNNTIGKTLTAVTQKISEEAEEAAAADARENKISANKSY